MSDTAVPFLPKKLVLVDGYSLLFRAFFGGRAFTTSDGRPTGALFGLANMLFNIVNSERPDAFVVCWDAPGQTNRAKEFEAYKAHRPAIDDALRQQFQPARTLVAAFGIAAAELEGYEADDLIGTLAKKGQKEGYQVIIFTGDTDQLQLVQDGITVLMTQRGVTEVKSYDAETVRERYGIGPERIADWKALVGDTSDNIPGVPGIGEKTATALLQKWDTLENILANLPEVTPPKARAALEANTEQAHFSKRLATIVCDVPAELTIVPYAPTEDDWTNLRNVFADLEFRTMLGKIPRGTSPGAETKRELEGLFETSVTKIGSAAELEAAIEAVRTSGRMAVVVEADKALPMLSRLRGIAFAPSPEQGYYVALRAEAAGSSDLGGLFDGGEEETDDGVFRVPLAALRPLFEDAAIARVGHGVKYAEILLEQGGLQVAPYVFDTEIAAYLLNAGRSGYPLMDLAENLLGRRLEIEDAFAPEAFATQAALVAALQTPMEEELAKVEMTDIMARVEMPLVPALAAVEQVGLAVDVGYLIRLAARMGQEADAIAERVYELAGEKFNIGSTKQLQTILFEKLKLPTGKKIKTGFSTGADLLEQLATEYEIARKIIEYREVTKLKSTYADALPKMIHPRTHRIHTSLHQTVASTGRLSSSDPNLQNIPVRSEIGREIRKAFVAPTGKVLLSCDYSQIELRILAHVTEDPALMEAFNTDADVHRATAATVFNVPLAEVTPDQRRQAKTINFAVIYGQSGFSLAATLGVDTATANQWIKEYFARLPGVKAYIEETTSQAHAQRYVSSLLGRRRYVPDIVSSNHNLRQFAERAAVNMPIQGTAADIMKLAMSAVHVHLRGAADCTLLLQVHDELLFEVEEAALRKRTAEIVEIMEQAYPMKVRLQADAKSGANWAEMTPVAG